MNTFWRIFTKCYSKCEARFSKKIFIMY